MVSTESYIYPPGPTGLRALPKLLTSMSLLRFFLMQLDDEDESQELGHGKGRRLRSIERDGGGDGRDVVSHGRERDQVASGVGVVDDSFRFQVARGSEPTDRLGSECASGELDVDSLVVDVVDGEESSRGCNDGGGDGCATPSC